MTYRDTFPKPHAFLAVVHAEDLAQVMRNVGIARKYGADGAFLINHSISPDELVQLYETARSQHQGFWLGLNLLGLDAHQALDLIPDLACGLWTDDAGIRDSGDCSEAEAFACYRSLMPWDGLYFGGVAFKGQETIFDPAVAARRAMPFMDVITTSGERTGCPPDIEKVKLMKGAVGSHPLAIASGISPANVKGYLPYADCFLVSTGVSHSHSELDPYRVGELAGMLSG